MNIDGGGKPEAKAGQMRMNQQKRLNMSKYLTGGAIITCTCGSAPSQLQATVNTIFSIRGNMVATTGDKVPMVNIKPFGTCSLKPSTSGFLPCMPAPAAWTGFAASVQMQGGNPLLQTSTIQCATGGRISFQNSGRMKQGKAITGPGGTQIDALKRAAGEAEPFCGDSEGKTGISPDFEGKKTETEPKILRIYCKEERDGQRELFGLKEGREVTLCVDVEDGGAGTTVDVLMEAGDDRVFEDGTIQKKYSGLFVEDDNTAYADNFSIKYGED
jgi:hypothetical protein